MYEKFIFTEYISREVMNMQKKVQIVSDGSPGGISEVIHAIGG